MWGRWWTSTNLSHSIWSKSQWNNDIDDVTVMFEITLVMYWTGKWASLNLDQNSSPRNLLSVSITRYRFSWNVTNPDPTWFAEPKRTGCVTCVSITCSTDLDMVRVGTNMLWRRKTLVGKRSKLNYKLINLSVLNALYDHTEIFTKSFYKKRTLEQTENKRSKHII